MQYQNMIMRGSINHRIVINPNFNWGNIDFINQKLQDAHDNGKLASKNVEGLAVHEMGHFLTYLDCDDEKKLAHVMLKELVYIVLHQETVRNALLRLL